ncbi:GNAT family N-acetyltransferase [Marinilactibacillus kalidii]|uniref:GNAT family N-acetyltransferase n=1 Tax=Marinilactibacillus kalidii TaxID=2820274 RepID=UPI001ABE40CF|nr:GNAT family N-acetyltransferase [Marinilactibacillus kalidii]
MKNRTIRPALSKEINEIETRLDAFNLKAKPLLQEKAFIPFNFTLIIDDQLVGGVSSYASLYKIGYIDTLWVDEAFRGQGFGKDLLLKVEDALTNYGCQVVHLETFDFQGPTFYEKCGYSLFGQLDYPHADLTEYFYAKTFI